MSASKGQAVARLSSWGLLRYAAAWAIGATALVLLGTRLLGDPSQGAHLPAIRAAALGDAVRAGGCTLVHLPAHVQGNPPVDGPPSHEALAGIYMRSPPVLRLTAAMRRGLVVIQYRPGLDADRLEELALLQKAVPRGTIVTPNATGMPFELAATAYRTYVGCPRADGYAVDAIRLFRGRYLGTRAAP